MNPKPWHLHRLVHTGGSSAVCLSFVVVAACGLYWSRTAVQRVHRPVMQEQVIYLPSVEKVKLVTLGFNNLSSDLLWFDTLNYFGKHINSDKDFRWLAHRCELVTDLDPKTRHAYEFCATMLSWIAKEPARSIRLLTKAIAAEPNYWRYRYLRGFTYWYFLENRELAQKDLADAARMADAPLFEFFGFAVDCSRTDPGHGDCFLRDLIARAQDDNSKQALEEQLKLAHMSAQFKFLERKLAEFERHAGHPAISFDQLIVNKLLPGKPVDPFGGTYFIDAESRQIKSTSGRQGLQFFGKTAATGLAQYE